MSAESRAQEALSTDRYDERGAPYMINFGADQYNAGAQNWGIAQVSNGLMYFANNSGVLEFDGISWRLIPVSNRTAARALALGRGGRIYVGAQGELGYLAADSAGFQKYISLLEFIPERYRDFADIAKTYATEQGIYFQALDRVFLWRDGKMQVWMPELPFHLSFVVNETFYIRQRQRGLMKLANDSLVAVPGGEAFADERIYAMLPFHGDDMIILTRTQGLFRFDGTQFMPFRTEADQYLLENQIYHAEMLHSGEIVIATLRGGVIILDSSGNLQQIVGTALGMQDNNVKYVFQDRAGNIWLALNNGLTQLELPSPVTVFDKRFGLSSSVNAIARHHGELYVGTGEGLSVLAEPPPGEALTQFIDRRQFSAIPEISMPTWSIISLQNSMLVSTGTGVFEMREQRVSQVLKTTGHAYALCRSKRDSNIVYIGLQDGLAALHATPNGRQRWQHLGKVSGVDAEVRSMAEDTDGNLWLGTRSQGFYRLKFASGFTTTPEVEHYTAGQGLREDHGWVIVFSAAEKICFVTDNGLLTFNSDDRHFLPDSSLGHEIANGTQIINSAVGDANGNIWLQSGNRNRSNIIFAQQLGDGRYDLQRRRYNRFADFRTWTILPEKQGVIWFGGPDGLVRYDNKISKDLSRSFSALIRAVTFGDSLVIFGGAQISSASDDDTADPAEQIMVLPYSRNSFRFEFMATSFEQVDANRYQLFLEGFANNWSSWTSETKKDYTYIPDGTYRFRVRARNNYEEISSEAVFAFRILPPWYRSWWAYTAYLMLFGLLVFGLIRLRTRQLEARSHELENIINERTQEILDTQEQLIVQEKMASLGQVTAGIAHEIKNPLNFVNNFAEGAIDLADELDEAIVKHKGKLEAADFEYIQEIVEEIKLNASAITENGKRADSIVKSMMDHARDTKGEFEETDLNALLSENISLAYHGYRAKIANFEVDIEKDFDPSIAPMKVIPQDLSRVFLNIIGNACYALHEKREKLGTDFQPRLQISTKLLDGKVEVRIRDNGPGIPDEIRNKIFNPFFTTKPTGEGNTGLGLSISYDVIVKQHKGELNVDSRIDDFTEFLITLPATSA